MLDEFTKALLVVVVVAGVGCKERSKLDTPPAPAPNKAAPVEASTEHGSSAAAPPQEDHPAAQAFCEAMMQKMLTCFDDAGFWDVFATTYFAKYPDPTGNPDAKKHWIGILKDDFAGLRQEKQLKENCGVMVRGLRLPTESDMQSVNAAMAKSCTDFGTAMGLMLFHKGVFHLPR